MHHLYLEAAGRYEQWRQVTVTKYNRWYQHAAAKLTEYRAEFHRQIAAHVIKMQGSLLGRFLRTRVYVLYQLQKLLVLL